MKITAALLVCLTPLFAAENPVVLYPGLGTWTHPIKTTSPEAQKFFDQGLSLNYGFNRYEALRSFRKAAELDPHAPMAFWGMAISQGPYVNMDQDPEVHLKEACDAVKAGLAIAGITETEKDWLTATGSRCPDFDPDRNVQAMKQLAAKYPDDPDAQSFYAEALMLTARWRWYGNDGKPAPGMPQAERTLEAVMRRFPYHPGANHFYIHAVESSPTPERAIPSAQRLMGIVPWAGHMVHMPGHIWLVVGDYNNAVAVNERAAEVDREYFARTGVTSAYYMYYLHNLTFILYARGMQGHVADARAAEKQFSEAVAPMVQAMPDMGSAFNFTTAMTRMRLCQWDDILAAPRPASGSPMDLALWRYPRAMALAGKGRQDEAHAEQAEFEKIRATLDRNMQWSTNKLGGIMDLASAVLEARLMTKPADAVPKWKHAVELQDALVYDEPPGWYYPVRESLGAALLRSGDAAAAEAVFREGRMLFGLMSALNQQGNTAAAAWVRKEYESAWKGADLTLRIEDL
jgi:tetratricopeptide (TPR) repeat protein